MSNEIQKLVGMVLAKRERIKKAKIAGMPEVGIFWVLPSGKLLVSSVPYKEGISYGDLTTGPTDHYQYWEQVRNHIPSIKDKEYDEVPRGRVSYNEKDGKTFIILGSGKMLRNAKVISEVKSEFKLSGHRVVLMPDEHYEM